MKKNNISPKILIVLLLLMTFAFNFNVYANTSDGIVTPDGVFYEQTFTDPDNWSTIYSPINAGAFQVGTLTMNVHYTTYETWLVDQFGNKIELLSSRYTIVSGSNSVQSAGSVSILESSIINNGQTYFVKTQLTYGPFATYIQNHYFQGYDFQ